MNGLRALMAAEAEAQERGSEQSPTVEDYSIDTPNPAPKLVRFPKKVEPLAECSHSDDAEKGVLSSVMQSSIRGDESGRKAMFIAEQSVGTGHFVNPANREIWASLKTLHENNDPLNFIAVTNEMAAAGTLEANGGAFYVTDVSGFVPTGANIDYYLGILKEKHAARQVANLADMLKEEARLGTNIAGALDDAQAIIQTIRTAKRIGELPDPDDMSMLIGENMPPTPPELIRGMLHQGSKIILGGTSKGMKTWSLMDMGISVATGKDWWGCPTIKGKVIYINFEIQRSFFARRYETICKAKGSFPDAGMFRCWTLRGLVTGIEEMTEQIIKTLQQEQYALAIFDPIYKALGSRDENKAGDVASMLNELEAIAVRTGAAIGFGAHYSKGNQAGKESIDRIGGSGVFARDPDAIITMTQHEDDEAFIINSTLRNFPPQPAFVVKWDYPLFTRDAGLAPEAIKKPINLRANTSGQFQKDSAYTIDRILDTLRDCDNGKKASGRGATELMNLMKSETGMSAATFWRLWNAAKDSNPCLIKQGNRWFHVASITNQ